jgi:large subunit ribosomal protein L18
MKKKTNKIYIQSKKRYLKKIVGTTTKPRLAVFRSHKHIYAQLIDDSNGKTILSSSTVDKIIREKVTKRTATKEASKLVGEIIAKKALEKNVQTIIFDRGSKPYHGRIAELAEGIRQVGLIF